MKLIKNEFNHVTGCTELTYIEEINKEDYIIVTTVYIDEVDEKLLELIKADVQKRFDEKRRELALNELGLFYY